MTALAPEKQAHALERALELAEGGRGNASPNPMVGAVLVDGGGQVVGEGFHARVGGLHAERAAIEDARSRGVDTSGCTLFVTLEPCAVTGRQPPCTDAILEAGIDRVVYADDDPSAEASGAGPQRLESAGVEVDTASEEFRQSARELNQAFRKRVRSGLPYVTYKAAMTLDGRTAASGGDSRWISGMESRDRVHRLRAGCDAIAVGIGTVLADDPLLTARPSDSSLLPEDPPLRVVFDSQGRLPLDSALVDSVDDAPVAVVVGPAAPSERRSALAESGVRVFGTDASAPAESAIQGMRALAGEADVQDLLCEGGATLAGALFDAELVDRMLLFLAPKVLGSADATPLVAGSGASRVAEARRALRVSHAQVGEDLLVDATFAEW